MVRAQSSGPAPVRELIRRENVAAGISLAAATMLLALAAVTVLQGIAALVGGDIYTTDVDYIYEFDVAEWGWIHVLIGAVAVICAFGLMLGTTWGRFAATGIAAVVIVANFLALPHYPAWSIVAIVLSVVVIWAVATWNPQL